MSVLFLLLALGAQTAMLLWLTRNDYAEGYRAGFFAAENGMDNDYATTEARLD